MDANRKPKPRREIHWSPEFTHWIGLNLYTVYELHRNNTRIGVCRAIAGISLRQFWRWLRIY